jgi:hypothetical protein
LLAHPGSGPEEDLQDARSAINKLKTMALNIAGDFINRLIYLLGKW